MAELSDYNLDRYRLSLEEVVRTGTLLECWRRLLRADTAGAASTILTTI
jgi:hypothetical protein